MRYSICRRVTAVLAHVKGAPFDYIGDSAADLPLFRAARRAMPTKAIIGFFRSTDWNRVHSAAKTQELDHFHCHGKFPMYMISAESGWLGEPWDPPVTRLPLDFLAD